VRIGKRVSDFLLAQVDYVMDPMVRIV
jgi:hypothetical protein